MLLYAGFFVVLGIAVLAIWGWIATLPMTSMLYVLGSLLMLVAVAAFLMATYAVMLARSQTNQSETQKKTVEVTRHESGEYRIKDLLRERQRSRQ